MKMLDGKILQKKLLNNIKKTVDLLEIKPTVAIISIGSNSLNSVFLKEIKKMCQFVGFEIKCYHYEVITEDSLLKLINKWNKDIHITSIMVNLPLPNYLSFDRVRNHILPSKDIDGVTDQNRIMIQNKEGGIFPAVVLGIINLLSYYHIDIFEKNVVIINRSKGIGEPLFHYFNTKNCTVTICHSKTKNLNIYLKNADIIISAIGKKHYLSLNACKESSIVIDVGMAVEQQKVEEDIDFSNQEEKIGYGVQAIGGTGPMTVAALAQNILTSYYLGVKDKDHDEFES